MNVRWKSGSRIQVSAAAAYRVMQKVTKANGGRLNLDEIVEMSKPDNAPLHAHFEWDDAKCGIEHRRNQAAHLVRCIEVLRDDMKVPTRVYESVSVVTESESGDEAPTTKRVYMRAEDILADPAARAELLGQAIRDLQAFRRRYHALSELAKVIAVIETEISKLG